jgi:hypothetical protein
MNTLTLTRKPEQRQGDQVLVSPLVVTFVVRRLRGYYFSRLSSTLCAVAYNFFSFLVLISILGKEGLLSSMIRRGHPIFSKFLEYCARPPSASKDATWTSLAKKMKISIDAEAPETKHIEKMKREGVYSVEDSIAKLEDELAEEMASALGKTGDKTTILFKMMNRAQEEYAKLQEEGVDQVDLERRRLAARTFNVLRQEAETARRNLIIHRQAVGFYWRNHAIVEEQYPLPARIQEPSV